jgi:hypothetical protein
MEMLFSIDFESQPERVTNIKYALMNRFKGRVIKELGTLDGLKPPCRHCLSAP